MSAPDGRPDFIIREGIECMDFDRVHAWLASLHPNTWMVLRKS